MPFFDDNFLFTKRLQRTLDFSPFLLMGKGKIFPLGFSFFTSVCFPLEVGVEVNFRNPNLTKHKHSQPISKDGDMHQHIFGQKNTFPCLSGGRHFLHLAGSPQVPTTTKNTATTKWFSGFGCFWLPAEFQIYTVLPFQVSQSVHISWILQVCLRCTPPPTIGITKWFPRLELWK